MARKYEFDNEQALKSAMELFWKKGYRATSMKDIEDKTGLHPGSIYNSFGDKHALFIAAVEHYGEVVTTRMISVLKEEGSPLENIRSFFIKLANTPSHIKSMGCLLSNTVVELAPHEEETARSINKIMDRIETAFLNCLETAKEVGEISPDCNTKAIASYLSTCTHGLIVTGKSLPSCERAESVVEVIMKNIK